LHLPSPLVFHGQPFEDSLCGDVPGNFPKYQAHDGLIAVHGAGALLAQDIQQLKSTVSPGDQLSETILLSKFAEANKKDKFAELDGNKMEVKPGGKKN
jgi:hypothetical protein